jgi:hypothetical protein
VKWRRKDAYIIVIPVKRKKGEDDTMKESAGNRSKPKITPRRKAERIVKFGPKASPIRAQIIKAVEKVAAEREAARGK